VLDAVAAALNRLGVSGAKLGVAVSGGADSVFLLHALRSVHDGPLVVLHVNHGLRGAASDADEAFVRCLAGDLPCYVAEGGVVVGNLEQSCRRARLQLFSQWRAAGAVDWVATGHTASDQAETVLLRLLRGTGPTGLRGVLPRTKSGLVRPLLGVSREAVREYLRRHGLAWREDASNDDPRFLRNRVRKELLPLLRDLSPAVEGHLVRLAAIAGLEERYWQEQITAGGPVRDVNFLRSLHPALRRRTLRDWISLVKGGLNRIETQHVEQLERLVLQTAGEGTVTLPGVTAVRSFDSVRLSRPGAPEYRYTEEVVLELDEERLQGELRVRVWQPGDRFQPAGRKEPILLKKLFQSARIPLWERKNWPIITDGVSIVWAHRFGADQKFVASVDSRNILRFSAQISGLDESISSSSTSCILRKQ
jgi:tRNA(Ile)-lysidine synthase